jgi:hypothetical protein
MISINGLLLETIEFTKLICLVYFLNAEWCTGLSNSF